MVAMIVLGCGTVSYRALHISVSALIPQCFKYKTASLEPELDLELSQLDPGEQLHEALQQHADQF